MIKNTKIWLLVLAVFVAAIGLFCNAKISTTNIATLNFPDFSVEKFIRSNNNSFVNIETVSLDDVEDILNYDMVMVRIHGVGMTSRHHDVIRQAIKNGIAVYSTESDNAEINSLSGMELKYISALMDNGSVKNYQSLFNYIREKIDKKIIFNGEYSEPTVIPADYFFHLGDDEFFATYDEYQKFYEQKGLYKKDASRVIVLSGNINMQNSNEEHIVAIVKSLEDRGMNVYPINSFGSKKLTMIRDVKPNLIINRPHGRLLMGGGEDGVDMLKELNIPMIAPLTVSELYDKWLTNRQGMEAGGMTSMSVVLPEIDGAIAPFAVAAQFERNGMSIFDAIPKHTEKFSSMVEKFTHLQTTKNEDKKIAIYYYKGHGKGNIAAAEIEGVQSLYNTLKMLKENGYKVTGLPSSAKELEAMVQQKAPVLGPYAMGAYDKFLKEGNPELIDVEQFDKWAKEILPTELIQQMKDKYGEAPGEYMGVEKDNKKYIAVARIEFGNVVILPQPLPSTGENTEAIVHGVDGAVAYPYVASYFWTRMGFKADAMIHFGTHGSLEFIPGKQIALSDYDWTDALVGDMPHFYIYTINNIGEGIIAKRRSYATLVSHMTAPFMQSELYDDLRILKDRVHRYEQLDESDVKQGYRETITKMSNGLNIQSALGLDTINTLNDEQIQKVHIYIEEIDGAKVADGLYTLGEEYTNENLTNTARLMSIDPIKYSLAMVDVAKGKITTKQMDNIAFMVKTYDAKTNNIIRKLLAGASPKPIFESLISRADLELYTTTTQQKKHQMKMRQEMMNAMASAQKEALPKFLDKNGNVIGKDTGISKMSMMKSMISGDIDDDMILGMLGDVDEEQGVQKVKNMLGSGDHGDMIRKAMKASSDEEVYAKVRSLIKARDAKMSSSKSATKKEDNSMMGRMSTAKSMVVGDKQVKGQEEMLIAIATLHEAVLSVRDIRNELKESTRIEEEALLDALNGGYIEPGSAGDPIINPKAITTGKNFYAINPETTPTPEAWKVGKRLAENLLEAEMSAKGKYPKKVSFTLWSSDFISSEGATIAQILYLLGVEPLMDGFGYIRSLKLIPANELNRPRIDVVVQTSGQLRDIAASRLALINRAIAMAAEDDSENNFVKKGFDDAERLLLDKGFSPIEARKYSRERVFGGANGNYGTGITGMVEKGDSWESQDQIAKKYIGNMGAMYSSNGNEDWGIIREGVFEAALLNTEVVIQPRSSNTWGALSLDHVYEFMGGLSAAVQHVTGEDPTAYFNDFRNSNRAKVQGLKEAIGVESNSTVFNPKYIKEMMKGESSSMSRFAEVFRNTYGWNAMKPSAIDQHLWNKYYDIYVKDEYKLGTEAKFAEKNPYALQEMTAVLMESARKGMWKASKQQLKDVAELHTKFVGAHQAACSGFVCDNAKLREFISQNVDQSTAKKYNKDIDVARQVQLNEVEADKSVVLKKEDQQQKQQQKHDKSQQSDSEIDNTIFYIIVTIVAIILLWFFFRHKQK